jgi:hypothetical protein
MVKMGPSAHCIRCGEPFMQGRLGRKAVYCGRTCRQRAHEEHRIRTLLAYELHRSLVGAAFQRGLLLPLLRARSGDTSQTENNDLAPGPETGG